MRLAAAIVLTLVGSGGYYAAGGPRPDRQPTTVINAIAPGGPEAPQHDLDNQARGEGLQRGASVGAAPSKAYPRPQSYLADRGYKYAFVPSPNWSGRGSGDPIEAVVIHVSGDGTLAGMDSWFGQTVSQVSATFGVDKDGTVHQYVEIGDVAWHAGIVNKPNLSNPLIASWDAQGINPNRRTVGIEMVLKPGQLLGDYPQQAHAFDDLLLWLVQTLNLPPDRVHIIGHNELDSVNRAQDPVCCWWPDGGVSYLASRLNPQPTPAPMQVTLDSINQRLQVVEERLGIGQ